MSATILKCDCSDKVNSIQKKVSIMAETIRTLHVRFSNFIDFVINYEDQLTKPGPEELYSLLTTDNDISQIKRQQDDTNESILLQDHLACESGKNYAVNTSHSLFKHLKKLDIEAVERYPLNSKIKNVIPRIERLQVEFERIPYLQESLSKLISINDFLMKENDMNKKNDLALLSMCKKSMSPTKQQRMNVEKQLSRLKANGSRSRYHH